jgi:hypothetical protein
MTALPSRRKGHFQNRDGHEFVLNRRPIELNPDSVVYGGDFGANGSVFVRDLFLALVREKEQLCRDVSDQLH